MSNHLEKTCKACKQTKGLDKFYRHVGSRDGLLNKCAECVKQDARDRWRKDIDKSRARARELYQRPEIKKQRARYALEASQAYAWKFAARLAVKKALYSGQLVRQPCEVCGDPKTDAHHPNYDEPLRVNWLCRLHHAARHIEEKNAAKEGA
jgi:hypothetical protein